MSESDQREQAAMRLCRQCGLCCDGSLFATVPLTPSEAARLEVLGLPIAQRDGKAEALLQPCAALLGIDCRHYEARPTPCRSFRCHQLIALSEGEASEPEALEQVTAARGRIAALAQTLGRDAQARGVVADARRQLASGELDGAGAEALAAVEAHLRAHFLGRGAR